MRNKVAFFMWTDFWYLTRNSCLRVIRSIWSKANEYDFDSHAATEKKKQVFTISATSQWDNCKGTKYCLFFFYFIKEVSVLEELRTKISLVFFFLFKCLSFGDSLEWIFKNVCVSKRPNARTNIVFLAKIATRELWNLVRNQGILIVFSSPSNFI